MNNLKPSLWKPKQDVSPQNVCTHNMAGTESEKDRKETSNNIDENDNKTLEDTSEEKVKEESQFLKGYCLYKHIANRLDVFSV